MTLAERIQKLISELETGLVERGTFLRLLFLAILTGQPTYLYGRAGSGKRSLIRHVTSGFKDIPIQIYGRRNFSLPEKSSPVELAVFTSFNSGDASMTNAIGAILDERLATEILLAGRFRPDAALAEAGLSDSIHLVLSLPDSVSPEALPALLSSAGDPEQYDVSDNLKISVEELNAWGNEFEKINLSEDSVILLQQIANECEKGNVYISAKRWRGLAKIARAEAFFAGRSTTNITDFLFLSEDLWGKRTTAEAIRKGFENGIEAFLDSVSPNPDELKISTKDLLLDAEHYKNSSGNRYKTISIEGKEHISYSITVFNESITLYVPLSRVGTSEDFFPLNALHRTETRAKCNFQGGDACKISIDSKAKRNGMRASSSVLSSSTANNTNATYEDYAKLPTEILRTNDPEIMEQNKIGLQTAHEKLFDVITNSLQSLKKLKAVYNRNSEFQNDPFLSKNVYKDFMNRILKRYKSLGEFTKELQQIEAVLSQASTGVN